MSEHEATTIPAHLQPVAAALRDRYPDLSITPKPGDWLEVKVEADASPEFFRYIKDTPGLGFDYLLDVTAVDYINEGKLQVVYHLARMGADARKRGKLVVKVDVPRDNARVRTVVDIWPTADFLEREVYDMFGVVFEGHPDLRRILMREDWVGHPLRKDYVDHRPKRTRVTR